MSFNQLAKIEKADWYIDLAFRKAKKAASEVKSQKRAGPDTIKRAELAKVKAVRRAVTRQFTDILKNFPSIDSLTEFYQELIRATLDYATLKQALGAVKWANDKVEFFSDTYHNKIRRCMDFNRMTGYSREYYGRISSVIKQVKKHLDYLEEARKVMRDYPSIKGGMFTVCLAGFPNVGKTTLLSKLTPSAPEIADYAFTTKKLNTGYTMMGNSKVQFIDTPGTLDRFEKMNSVEKQAYLAMKYCADLIVFVFDTGDKTYDAKQQLKLLSGLKRFGKEIVVYLSKTDMPGSVPKSLEASARTPQELRKLIAEQL